MQILKEENIYAKNQLKRTKRYTLFFGLMSTAFFFLFLFFSNLLWLMICILVLIGVISFFFSYTDWRQGIKAEKIVTDSLRNLDDSYYLINDIVLPKRRANIDHIILGSTGIFVIETKSYDGEIKCERDDWWQDNGHIKSFSKQAKRNSTTLRRFIRKHINKDVWVEGVVVLTDPNIKLELKYPSVAVLRPHELCNFIRNSQSEFSLSPQELKMLGDKILKHSKKDVN